MVTRFNVRTFILGVLLWAVLIPVALVQNVVAAPVSVRVNPAVVVKNETVVLTVSIDSDSLESPDFSVLTNDFKVLKTANTSSIHNEDGVTLIRKNWVLTLLPLKKGKLTIPSIKIGNERTPPLSLQVKSTQVRGLQATDTKSNDPLESVEADNDVFVEVETDIQEGNVQDAYVQGQIVLTQKIYHSIPLESASLSPPVVKDDAAEIVALAKEAPYYWRVKGKRYHVIERSYALFPKHSGSLQIEKAKLTAKTKSEKRNEKNSDSSNALGLLTGSSASVREIEYSTPAITLTIEPQEKSYGGDYWLPAKNITLYGNWPKSLEKLEIGEPVTLQLGIIADGLRAEQLPDIKLKIPDTVKSYLEPIELNNNITLTGVTGVWSQKITLIPSQPEEVVIPEFQLAWWNIETQRQETATLKTKVLAVNNEASAETVEKSVVKGSSSLEKNASPVDSLIDNKGVEQSLIEKYGTESNTSEEVHSVADQKENVAGWNRLAFIIPLFVLLLLVGYFFYRFSRKSSASSQGNHKVTKEDKKQLIFDALKLACLENNPQKVQQLLPQWASDIAGIKPSTFEGIEKANNGHMRNEIKRLSKALYGRSASTWKGVSFWDAIKKYPYSDSVQTKRTNGHLQDMYPR